MIFDWTISIGNLLTIMGVVGAGAVFVIMIRADVTILAARIAAIETVMKDMARVQVLMAEEKGRSTIIEERLNIVSRRLDTHINESVSKHTGRT